MQKRPSQQQGGGSAPNAQRKAWTRPSMNGPGPSARCAHSASMVGNGNVFVYGGWDGNQMLNDLHVLHTDLVSAPQPILTWSKPITSGPVPGPRAGHTSSAVGNRLFVFGGGNGIRYLNDLHLLDAETMTWSQAYVAGTSPAARSRHTATLVGTKLVVIGGGDDSRVYNDVYVLDTVTMSWTRPITKGSNPPGRWGHTATLIGTDQLLIFGGHDGTRMLNDVHILDTESMAWQQISPHGQIPCPRAGHTATSVTGKLLVFGGGDGSRILNDLYVFDPATLTFTRPTLQHPAHTPAGRCAHTATPLDDSTLLVFGGGDGGRRFKDLYLLDAEQVIKPPKEKTKGQAKTPARRGSAGHADDKRKNDITVWLSGLGLRKYVDKFVHEEIDVDTLPYLTEEHLEKLGVTTIGARLKILAAVDQLRDEQAGRALAGPNRKPSVTLRRSTDLVGEMKQSLDLLLVATSALAQALSTLSYPDKEEASGGEGDEETETESDFDNSLTPSPVASPRDKVSSMASSAAALASGGGGGGIIPTPPPPPPPHFYASTTDHINALNSFFRNPGSCRGNTNTNLSCGSASTQIIPGVHLHLPNNATGGGGAKRNNGGGGGGSGGGAAATKANLRHSQGKLPQHTAKPPAGGSGGERAGGGAVGNGNGNGNGGDAEKNATKAPP